MKAHAGRGPGHAVTNSVLGTVSVIDTTTNAVTTITAGTAPFGVAIG